MTVAQPGVTRRTPSVTFPPQATKGGSFNTMKVAAATYATVKTNDGATPVYYSTLTVADLTGMGRAAFTFAAVPTTSPKLLWLPPACASCAAIIRFSNWP